MANFWSINQDPNTGSWVVTNDTTNMKYYGPDARYAVSEAIRTGDMPASNRAGLEAKAAAELERQKAEQEARDRAAEMPAPVKEPPPPEPKVSENAVQEDGTQPGSTSAPQANTESATVLPPDAPAAAGQKTNKSSNNQKNSMGSSAEKAGRRQYNPLSKLSSYTYNVGLLMINPEAYNIFAASGGKLQKTVPGVGGRDVPGYYVVAQSGGISQDEYRAITIDNEPGQAPGLDFFIDDVNISTLMSAADGSNTPTNEAGITFKIIEPYGFNFIQSLTDASNKLTSESEMLARSGDTVTAYQQMYLIVVRFYGYDVNGKLVTSTNSDPDLLGGELSIDGSTDPNALFERFFSIQIENITFKLDGKTVVYNVTAAGLPLQTAFSLKCGLINKDTEIYASTVEEALGSAMNSAAFFTVEGPANSGEQREVDATTAAEQARLRAAQAAPGSGSSYAEQARLRAAQAAPGSGSSYKPPVSAGSGRKGGLMEILNQQLQDEVDLKQRSRAGSYLVQFDPRDPSIKDSRLVNKDAGASGTNGGNEVTVRQSAQAQNNNTSKIRVTLSAGTSIVQAIEEIISQSTYVTDALKQVNDSNVNADQSTKDTQLKLRWFHINPVVKIKDRDPKLNDWVWDICYQIRSYDIPYIRSTYKSATDGYYGATKRYEYWLTGLNTEVLDYTQQFDNFYFTATTLSNNVDRTGENTGQGNTVSTAPLGGSQSSTGGPKTNRGGQIEQNVKGALYGASTADQAEVKLRIVGDPDWLMSPITVSESLERLASKRYAKDNSIDPNGGQVFVEINFNTAQDYARDGSGLLDVNRNINFYQTDILKKNGIEGLVYHVHSVESSFVRGKFEQILDLALVDESTLFPAQAVTGSSDQRETTSNGAGTGGGNLIPLDASGRQTALSDPRVVSGQLDSTNRKKAFFDPRVVELQRTLAQPTIPSGKTTVQDDQPVAGRPRGGQ